MRLAMPTSPREGRRLGDGKGIFPMSKAVCLFVNKAAPLLRRRLSLWPQRESDRTEDSYFKMGSIQLLPRLILGSTRMKKTRRTILLSLRNVPSKTNRVPDREGKRGGLPLAVRGNLIANQANL